MVAALRASKLLVVAAFQSRVPVCGEESHAARQYTAASGCRRPLAIVVESRVVDREEGCGG
jgi:hypothetical protein